MTEIELLEQHKTIEALIDREVFEHSERLRTLKSKRDDIAKQILALYPIQENTLSKRLVNGGQIKIVRKVSRTVNQSKVAEIVEDPGQESRLKTAFVAKSSYSLDTKAWRALDDKTQSILLACGAVTERWVDAEITYTPPALDVDGNVCTQSPHREVMP